MKTDFILDSNFFIQAHRIIYPLDVATGFWEKIKSLIGVNVFSIDKVKDEIFENEDELKIWIETNINENSFINTQTPEVLIKYGEIVNWVDSQRDHYLPKAIDEFLEFDNADPWLIAYAMTSGNEKVIVTYETSEPNKISKIKIPDICRIFNIKCVNTIEMFRGLGQTF